MSHMKPKFIMVQVLLLMSLSGACQKSKKGTSDDDDSALRLGRSQPLEALKYYDALPSLSSDGTKIVFTSGRTGVSRSYIYSVAAGEVATRLTKDADSIDEELQASLTADGNWVLFAGRKSGQTDLFARRFDSSGSLLRLTTDTKFESEVAVHPTSEIYAFTQRPGTDSGETQVMVGALTTDGPATSQTNVTEDEYVESNPTWLTDTPGGPYRLVVRQRGVADFDEKIVLKTYSLSGQTVSLDSSETLYTFSGTSIDTMVNAVAADDGIVLAQINSTGLSDQVKARSALHANRYGNKTKYAVANRPVTITSGSSSLTVVDSLGTEVRKLSAADSGLVLAAVRAPALCKRDATTFADVMVLTNTSASYLVPGLDKNDKAVGSTTSPCVENSSDFAQVDISISDAIINRSATASSYTIVYVTTTTGDHEVVALQLSSGQTTYYRVSANAK